jgi:hypothetical protein
LVDVSSSRKYEIARKSFANAKQNADGSMSKFVTLYGQYSSGGTPNSASAPIVERRYAPVSPVQWSRSRVAF